MNTPVVLTVFNRPKDTQRVFDAIRQAQPRTLFIIADAPRNETEAAVCEAARAVAEDVDWDCDVYKNYAPKNMGAKMRLATGITWVFEQVDRAIILEHDCLPHPDFFPFCEELLERYKDDERIMHIGGSNFDAHVTCPTSYYFSVVPLVWGFATWARAWKYYDVELKLWPQAQKEAWLSNVFDDLAVRDRWEYRFQQYYEGTANSWDGQWTFACCINNGLSINPRVNLISNIGFGPEAFTTTNPNSPFANVPTEPLPMPLVHPTAILPNRAAEAYLFKYLFAIKRYPKERVTWFLKLHFPPLYRFLKKMYSIGA